MPLIDTRKYDEPFLLGKIFLSTSLSEEERQTLFKHFEKLKTGWWKSKMLDKFRKYEAVCSECGARYVGNYDSYDEPCDFNYCPNCGARMEGEQDGN